MTLLQVSKLDNDPASMASGSGRAALPRAAPAATPFRAFKRADISTSELTKDDLIAAGKYTGNEPGTSACRYPKMQVHTSCLTSTNHVAFIHDIAFTMTCGQSWIKATLAKGSGLHSPKPTPTQTVRLE